MSLLSQFFGGSSGAGNNKPAGAPVLCRAFLSSGSITIPRDGWYQFLGVGAGGSGGMALLRGASSGWSAMATGGAPGASMKDTYWLTAGTVVTVVIGAPGAQVLAQSNTANQAFNGNAGGATTIQIGTRPLITLGGGEGGKASVTGTMLAGALPGTATGLSYTPQKGGSSGSIDFSGVTGTGVRLAATGGAAANFVGRTEAELKTGNIAASGVNASPTLATGGGSPGGGSADVSATTTVSSATHGGGMGGASTSAGSPLTDAGPDVFGNRSLTPIVSPTMPGINLGAPFLNLVGNGGAGVSAYANAVNFSTSLGGANGGLVVGSTEAGASVDTLGTGAMAGSGGVSRSGTTLGSITNGADAGSGAGSGGVAVQIPATTGTNVRTRSGAGGSAFLMVMEL